MTNARTVVFDLGKVLLDFDYSKSSRLFAARSKATPQEVESLINHSPLLFRYETGLMTREEFAREVCTTTSFAGNREEFGQIFADIFVPIPEMIELHAALRKHGIPTFIFSNTNDLAIGHIRQKYPFFANFDGYIFSYEHCAMKPTAKLYEMVERETGGAAAKSFTWTTARRTSTPGRRAVGGRFCTKHPQNPARRFRRRDWRFEVRIADCNRRLKCRPCMRSQVNASNPFPAALPSFLGEASEPPLPGLNNDEIPLSPSPTNNNRSAMSFKARRVVSKRSESVVSTRSNW